MNATSYNTSIHNRTRSQGSGTLRKNLSIERSMPSLALQSTLGKPLLRKSIGR